MDLINFLSDDELLGDAAPFYEAAVACGEAAHSVPTPSFDVDDATILLMCDSAYLDSPPVELDCFKDIKGSVCRGEAVPKQRVGDKRQLEKEKNRLKQATYRQKMKIQRTELEARMKGVESKLMRAKAAKVRLSSVKSIHLTRLKMAAYALDNAVKASSNSAGADQVLSPSLGGGPYQKHNSVPGESSLILTNISPVYSTTRAYPRPLDSFTRTASVSHEHVLPHLPHYKKKQQSTSLPDIPEQFPAPPSSNISFADVTLVRDALECHQRLTLAGMCAIPAETAWFLLFPYEVRTGLRLSHSTTMASPSCHLSTSIAFWTVALESAFLKLLEDRLLTAQPARIPHSTDIQELRSTSESGSFQSQQSCPTKGSDAGIGQRPPKAPKIPLHVPTPQLPMLLQYGVMCGENRRAKIVDAVRTVMPEVMLRYRKQLPLEEWGAVCMQVMHLMQAQLECVQQCADFKARTEYKKKQQSEDVNVEVDGTVAKSQGAVYVGDVVTESHQHHHSDGGEQSCMGGRMHQAGQDEVKNRESSHDSVATGPSAETSSKNVQEEFAVHPGLLEWISETAGCAEVREKAAQSTQSVVGKGGASLVSGTVFDDRRSNTDEFSNTVVMNRPPENRATSVAVRSAQHNAGPGTGTPIATCHETEDQLELAAPGMSRFGLMCMPRMQHSNDETKPVGVWGLPHEKINHNELEEVAVGSSAASPYAEYAACCAEAGDEAVPLTVCGFGGCVWAGGEAGRIEEGKGSHTEDWGGGASNWGYNAIWPVEDKWRVAAGGDAAQQGGEEGGSGTASECHADSPFQGLTTMHGVTGVALAKVAANCVPDSDSSQHVQHSQHADGVAECPWSELQAVAIETVKLMLATMNETYSENNASDVKESLCGEMNQTAMKNTRGKKKQQPEKAASTSASAEDCDGLQEGGVEPAMTHECLVERAQALNISTALSATLLLSDAPVAYRHMTQPPVLAISWVEARQMRVYQYMRFNRTQKEHFAAMWRGWKRRRHALDHDFHAALSLLSTTLPSQPPSNPTLLNSEEAQHANGGGVATGVPGASADGQPHRYMHAADGVDEASLSLQQQCSSEMKKKFSSREEILDSCQVGKNGMHLNDTEDLRSKAQCSAATRMSLVLKLLEGSSNDACMHVSVVQQLISGACSEADTAHAVQEGGQEVGPLGSSGVGMAAAQVALEALRGVHNTDDRMLRDYSALVLMTTWGLSEVEMRRYWAALLEVQVPTVDVLLMFRTAAHDIAHDDLFASVQFLGL